MTNDPRYYAKICAECKQDVIKLFLTPVRESAGTTTFRMLCEPCAAKIGKK